MARGRRSHESLFVNQAVSFLCVINSACSVTGLRGSRALRAIGFTLRFLDAAARDAPVTPAAQYELYRMAVHPDAPELGFAGFNSSFIITLSAEPGRTGCRAGSPARCCVSHPPRR